MLKKEAFIHSLSVLKTVARVGAKFAKILKGKIAFKFSQHTKKRERDERVG